MISLKNIFKSALLLGLTTAMVGCSDMLESDSERQNFEPSIESKTDSVFYAYGIFEAMQHLADQYVFQGEMRGDLVATTKYTDNNLRQLANFSATTANKYDSAYVYYRVINNCNYYIAKRKTNLYTGSTNVVMNEYAAIKALRAWAYLQLGRNYERVPFFTEPLTSVSQIDNNKFPELTLDQIVDQLAPDLEQYTGYQLPRYGSDYYNAGTPNWTSAAKNVVMSKCFIPVDVILGDMYLETGQYDAAAKHFVTYLTQFASSSSIYWNMSPFIAPMTAKMKGGQVVDSDLLPSPSNVAVEMKGAGGEWSTIFSGSVSDNSFMEIISYIPMAVNKQQGPTTIVPLSFGFNYYATSEERGDFGAYVEEIQITPSDALNTLSDSTEYYYYAKGGTNQHDNIQISKAGDMRLRSITTTNRKASDNSEYLWIDKYKQANIILYRTSTVMLHLAEAFNRLGMPDAAFGILKDGISSVLTFTKEANPGGYPDYITDDTRTKLTTIYPLFSSVNIEKFNTAVYAYGIHSHGAGKATGDCASAIYRTGTSPYKMPRIVGKKLDELNAKVKDNSYPAGITIGTTKQDTINAIEDILCDEYALELAFEGNRFYDLCRLARHKNGHAKSSTYDGSPYGANFGGVWLADKLKANNPVVDLKSEKNWYLPFK
ncbi:RagB/SusD family nutrient uptake outer membrane protein [Prevotella sp. E13-27]|uniref:RagB/SusD family nutrient uptake outer membrane protein n=1 Tax=Prevotella sp. E13-27 TaxID=2938122 RepID=UPI00200AEAA6|nr:RagB/SusD family nutrient uptake outer membrane protein [Prevotella sp. E13-27]MCK8621197.1 RagB/SusD family nutrient uptake outer membrane protein [Prevotella sp. E13-27]